MKLRIEVTGRKTFNYEIPRESNGSLYAPVSPKATLVKLHRTRFPIPFRC